MECLDDGLLQSLCTRLPAKSLCALSQVDSRLRRLASEQVLWRASFERDYPEHYRHAAARPAWGGQCQRTTAGDPTAVAAAAANLDWRQAYRSRLEHDARWHTGQLQTALDQLRSHAGPVFGCTFLDAPFPPGLALSGGVCGPEESAELTLWELGRGQFDGIGRLGWQLPTAGLQNLAGVFDVQQRPGTMQVVLCGFGSQVNIATIRPLDTYTHQEGPWCDHSRHSALTAPAGPSVALPEAATGSGSGVNGSGDRRSSGRGSSGSGSSEDGSGSGSPGRHASSAPRRSEAVPVNHPGGGKSAATRIETVVRLAEGGVDVGGGYGIREDSPGAASGSGRGRATLPESLASMPVETPMPVDLSNLSAWLLRETTNLKFSAERDAARLPPLGSGYTLQTDYVLAGHQGACVTADTQGSMAATASFDGTIKLWHLPDDEDVEPSGSTGTAAAGREPRVLAPAASLADNASGEAVPPPVCAARLRPDCQVLLSGGNDRQVKVWDVERCSVVTRMDGHLGWVWSVVALQDDFNVLATGATDSNVCVWDARAGARVGMVEVSSLEPDNVYPIGGLAARVDGRYLVAGCFDGSIYVIDRRQMQVLHKFTGHTDRVTRVSCQGDAALSGAFDGNLCLWQW